ncbi:response regulator transcription factor [Sphingoaurantiacus capsulatus]|uniref:Response regulator transcription factor n=1 Tax=Sphingoaurantiacus capsulatus TaxID=1771310 RepID=A0ABV7XAH1_9SPHN
MPQVSIIDDDDSLRGALVSLVKSFGYGAQGFDSAEQFLAAGGAAGFDCIVTDIHMPGLSGIELKQQLSADHDSTPVIMITARSEPALRERAKDSGALCLLTKPFEASELIACIEQALAA